MNNKTELKDIPIMPQVATKIIKLQEDNLDISFKELGNIILLDPALTAKILKVANSALYARQKEITSIQQAITLLGFKTIKSLVLLVCASNIFGKSKKRLKSSSELYKSKSSEIEIWRHLVLTAFLARHISTSLNLDQYNEEIFIAGLLHDIGRIILLINNSEAYEGFLETLCNKTEQDILSIEEEIFGYHHAEVGKIVLEKWNFPDELIDTVYQHHSTSVDSAHKKMILIVALANLYSRILSDESFSDRDVQQKEEYMKALNLTPEIDEYITTHFMKDIENDELFTMSTDLIE
ncbi:MAG: HDOD domain-containing protein [Spirochaetota bacterium]|nr:HDOD domain-containing protein [Spirochaetota bacterium]